MRRWSVEYSSKHSISFDLQEYFSHYTDYSSTIVSPVPGDLWPHPDLAYSSQFFVLQG
jgi:hypothetical protein